MADEASERVTLVERLELMSSTEAFEEAVAALCRRVADEGVSGLLTYQFYFDAHDREVGVIMTFANGDAFMEHNRLVNRWEEWTRFGKTANLVEIRLYGNPGEEMEAYLLENDIDYEWGGWHVAGFAR